MRRPLVLVLTAMLTAPAAAEPWSLCLPMELGPELRPQAGGGTRISGRRVEGDEGRLRIEGEARLETPERVLESGRLVYDRERDVGFAEQDVRLSDGNTLLEAERAELSEAGTRGTLENVRYRIVDRHARGGASQVTLEEGDRIRLLDFTYTTCDPGSEFWRLEGPEVVLDQEAGFGTAYHANVRIRGVPVFYLPVFSFPIDDRRKTGFLAPRIGGSDELGTELRIPWYWNIAPQYDLTLTPRLTGRRGAFLGLEFRHLQRRGTGRFEADLIPDDRLLADRARWLARWREKGRMGVRWSYRLDVERASDAHYLEDFGETLAVASTTHLEQTAELTYLAPRWRTRLRLQAFQTVDSAVAPADRPYRRLPALETVLRNPPRFGPLEPALQAELARFDHDVRIDGVRLDVRPALAWPVRRPWGFVVPRLWWRYTAYELNEGAAEPRPRRSLPGFSLDAGLVFERPVGELTQTLEPRLYYLRVPYRDQTALPVFDSTHQELTFAALFRDDRFTGADRVGDADQLTLAVTTRLLRRRDGAERLRASLGQILYFRDRRVTLPGEAVGTAARSALVAEVEASLPGAWRITGDARYDTTAGRAEKLNARFQYRPDPRHILNVSYRFEAGALRQSDLSFRWPLGRRWFVVGRWNRDLAGGRDLETFLGAEYESCCWMLRVVTRRFVNDQRGEANTTFYIQLVLKGLTRVGDRLEDLLGRGILGYPQQP